MNGTERWSAYLSQLKMSSRDAKSQWLAHDCPNNGPIWDLYQTHKRAYKKSVKVEKRKNKTACANRLFDAQIVGDGTKLWNCFNKRSTDVFSLQGAGDLKPDMFANVFKDNFVNSAVNGRTYNNHVHDRAKASKEWDNK